MKFEDIQRVNETIKTLDVKGKEYAEVNQRIKAFRMLYPEGFLLTKDIQINDGMCVITTECGYYKEVNGEIQKIVLGEGVAYEKEGSTFINKTSFIENCQTSSWGRCLSSLALGIDTSVASAEEVQNAIVQQEEKSKPDTSLKREELYVKLSELIEKTNTAEKLIEEAYKVKTIRDLTIEQYNQAIKKLESKLGE